VKNLRRKGAVWYYDHGGKPRKWESLGRDEVPNELTALGRYHLDAIRRHAGNGPGTARPGGCAHSHAT